MKYLIVGSSSAVGKELISQLTDQGHDLVVTGRQDSQDSNTLFFDATSTSELNLGDQVLDGLVYLPGTISLRPFNRISEEDFLKDLQINFLGAARVIRQALPQIKKSSAGSIVLFSTVAVAKGLPFHTSIAAAKGAVEGFGRSLAAELAPQIRVNMIAPSLTDTPLAEKLLSTDQKRKAANERHPLKRVGTAADLASTAAFLLSEKSSWITGQVLRVDGGYSSISG